MDSNNKPTIVFVPGAWHKASQYSGLTNPLKAAGYTVESVDYPSTSSNPDDLPENFDGDVASVRNILTQLADKGQDIVLVVHSAGGLIGSSAARGFAKSERGKGGIVKMVYICAFALPEGVSINVATGGLPSWQTVEGRAVRPLTPAVNFYNLCPREAVERQIPQLGYFAVGTLDSKATYEAWKHIPSAYLICENDQALPLQAQEGMVGQPGTRFEVERCAADHSPFLSMPGLTVDFVRRAAGEVM